MFPRSDRAREVVGTSELTDAALRRFLHGLPGVDQVGAQARAADLSTRSIKTTSKAWAIDLAISMIDLTTLEGADTHGKVRSLCAKATTPDPGDLSCPRVAAICVYNDLVGTAIDALTEYGGRVPGRPGGSWVNVAAVATAFPSGRASQQVKLADTHDAVRGRRRRGRHGDRPRRLPVRALPAGVRRDRGHPRGLPHRGPRRPPQGHPGDRRAGDVRQRPARVLAGDAGRRRLHQDEHRQGRPGGDAAGDHADAAGGP